MKERLGSLANLVLSASLLVPGCAGLDVGGSSGGSSRPAHIPEEKELTPEELEAMKKLAEEKRSEQRAVIEHHDLEKQTVQELQITVEHPDTPPDVFEASMQLIKNQAFDDKAPLSDRFEAVEVLGQLALSSEHETAKKEAKFILLELWDLLNDQEEAWNTECIRTRTYSPFPLADFQKFTFFSMYPLSRL